MLKYHEPVEDDVEMHYFMEKEKNWDNLMAKFDDEGRWSEKEIQYLLQSIQEYFYCCLPKSSTFTDIQYKIIIDRLLRVAMALACRGILAEDYGYISRNLWGGIKYIISTEMKEL